VPGPKTNEREGTRAVLRNTRTSAYKIREILDLVRNKPVGEARDILRFSERDAAALVLKLLNSAVANAENNDGMVGDELFVSACFADEGRTYKTFRPRARGRAGRLRKRTAHNTLIVSRLPEDRLGVVKAKQEKAESDRRTRRVAASQKQGGRLRRRRGGDATEPAKTTAAEDEGIVDQQEPAITQADEAAADTDTTSDTPSTDVAVEDADTVDQQDDADASKPAAQAEDEEK
jgi:large subunit ribosomal protein L22